MALEPLRPDHDYCVYCHAVAAGPCAACGAICCGDCVDLVMGLTTRRAVCHSCLGEGRVPTDAPLRRWLMLAAALMATGGLIGIFWLTWR
jgi:hypothetical protein